MMEESGNIDEIEDLDFWDGKPTGERWPPLGANDLDEEPTYLPMTSSELALFYEQVRNRVKEEFDGFYERCIAYLDLWENSFGNVKQLSWINLTKTNAVDWENAETSAEIINSSLDVPDMKINNDQLFDELVLAKEYLQSNWEQWKQEETTRDVIISSEEKCLRLFGHFKENHIETPNLIKIVEYTFCLPGTSPVERVFSLMNNAWTDDRGLMKESTVQGLMTCTINI
uniref:HAT C-terminal dimerisation domain-containing protein n=1 Tax=Timema tahoe TaxID=61484 RepID=A0A7R9IQ02_9NEOP|nr:unnamed protein product [Timema tahoe]